MVHGRKWSLLPCCARQTSGHFPVREAYGTREELGHDQSTRLMVACLLSVYHIASKSMDPQIKPHQSNKLNPVQQRREGSKLSDYLFPAACQSTWHNQQQDQRLVVNTKQLGVEAIRLPWPHSMTHLLLLNYTRYITFTDPALITLALLSGCHELQHSRNKWHTSSFSNCTRYKTLQI